MFDLPFTLSALRSAYREGLSPEAVVEEVYRRIDHVSDPGIFIHLLDKSEVLNAAKAIQSLDPNRPFWGIPFVIKDNMDLEGKPTTAACPAFTYQAEQDAIVVKMLKDAGALLIGKTNLDQFATGLAGLRSPYPPPKNAVDPEIVPGGSSSGSAVAVGHGIVCFSLGTDTAGSVRVPAALNNIVSIKPTLGMVSSSGVVPACRTLDTVGVLALTVEDAFAVFQVIAGYDANDAFSRDIPLASLPEIVEPLRIGVPDANTIEFFGDVAQEQSFADTISLLREDGAQITELDFTPFFDVAQMLYDGPWMAERLTVIEELLQSQPDALHAVTAKLIGKASGIAATDTFRALYRLKELARNIESILADLDLICVPSIPTFYSVAELEVDPIGPASKLGTYTNFVNLLDMCGITVPVSARQDGRPGSVTLLATTGQDALLASIGNRLEKLATHTLGGTGWTQRGLEV